MTLHRMTIAAAVMAAFTASATAVGPSPPEQPTAGNEGDRTTGQTAPIRLTPEVTPGWSLMMPQERQQLQHDVQAAKSRDECRALMDQHTQKMADRANARGITTAGSPRRDACAGM
jgi:hypothetical protein